jgi:hypothetical protein
MRLTDILNSWSAVSSWLSLVNGAPLSALVLLTIYLRPVALKWIECRARSSDIRVECDCRVQIERIRSTPPAPTGVVVKPKQRGTRKHKLLPPDG